jgi:hypothetical protein
MRSRINDFATLTLVVLHLITHATASIGGFLIAQLSLPASGQALVAGVVAIGLSVGVLALMINVCRVRTGFSVAVLEFLERFIVRRFVLKMTSANATAPILHLDGRILFILRLVSGNNGFRVLFKHRHT